MTIHQLLQARKHRITGDCVAIPPAEDVLVADGSGMIVVHDGDFFVAIDRSTKRYAAQIGDRIVRGRSDVALSTEELSILSSGRDLS